MVKKTIMILFLAIIIPSTVISCRNATQNINNDNNSKKQEISQEDKVNNPDDKSNSNDNKPSQNTNNSGVNQEKKLDGNSSNGMNKPRVPVNKDDINLTVSNEESKNISLLLENYLIIYANLVNIKGADISFMDENVSKDSEFYPNLNLEIQNMRNKYNNLEFVKMDIKNINKEKDEVFKVIISEEYIATNNGQASRESRGYTYTIQGKGEKILITNRTQ
ncbi:TcaA NTF2-like domain-containing protein [Clostridium polynesiense]|uniref:TcaA NTF2-like domain-containing protein n=1 Tax=Clostridium polynesiense TaxID=1325933 RepID=UPI00058E24A1|nr:hypothetical protein [Clostridium polynesiense]